MDQMKRVLMSQDEDIRDLKDYHHTALMIPLNCADGKTLDNSRATWIAAIKRGRGQGNPLGRPHLYFGKAFVAMLMIRLSADLAKKDVEARLAVSFDVAGLHLWLKAHSRPDVDTVIIESVQHLELHRSGGKQQTEKKEEGGLSAEDLKKGKKDPKKARTTSEGHSKGESVEKLRMIFCPRKEAEDLWNPVLHWYKRVVAPSLQIVVLPKQAPLPIVRGWKEDFSRRSNGRNRK
jgi:hypothetical protein